MNLKPLYCSVVLAALGTLAGCKKEAPAPVAEIAPPVVREQIAPMPTGPQVRPQGDAPAPPSTAEALPQQKAQEAAEQALPPGIHVEMSADVVGRPVLSISESRHLLSLRHGSKRAVGYGKVSLCLEESLNMPVIWERTAPDEKLSTLRGEARLGSGAPLLRLAEEPEEVASEHKGRHFCRAFRDGAGGFSVICRVQGMVSAVNLNEHLDPKERVFVQVGEPNLVRMDLPMIEGAVESVALGYPYAGMGLVMRSESIWLPGESKATFAMQSAERRQPESFPRFPHKHPPHIRHPFMDDFL